MTDLLLLSLTVRTESSFLGGTGSCNSFRHRFRRGGSLVPVYLYSTVSIPAFLLLKLYIILLNLLMNPGKFEKQGHRGCAGLLPENTIEGMLKAVQSGVTNLEMDIAVTKDNKAVVSHDPYFNHIIATKPTGEPVTVAEEKSLVIYETEYEEVRRYDVGLRGNPAFPYQGKMKAYVPLLSELIDAVENFCNANSIASVTYNLEIKSHPSFDGIYYPAINYYVELIMQIVNDRLLQSRTVIISFDSRPTQYVHQNYPSVKTGLISENMKLIEEELNICGFIPDYYSPDYTTVTKALIEYAHTKGLKVIPWSVNETKSISYLKSIGVNGIITDYPELLK